MMLLLQTIQFPLRGSFIIEASLITEWIITALFYQLSLVFYKRAKQDKYGLKSLQERAYFWVYFSFSTMLVLFIVADYYVESNIRGIFLNCGYISLMTGVFIFIFSVERNKIFKFKYIFSGVFLVDIVLFFVVLFIAPWATKFMSFTFWPLFIAFFLFFIKELRIIFKENPVLGNFRLQYIILLVGITLLMIGFSLTTDFIIQYFGMIFRFIGDIMQFTSLLLLFIFFKTSPSFSEYEWQDKIESIFIMHKSGLLICQKSFKGSEDEEVYEPSKSGVLTSLKMMLDNISDQNEAAFIEIEGKLIFIQPGEYVYGVLICNKKLNSLITLLNNLIKKIERLYSNVIKDWDGNLEIFKPLNGLVKEFFY